MAARVTLRRVVDGWGLQGIWSDLRPRCDCPRQKPARANAFRRRYNDQSSVLLIWRHHWVQPWRCQTFKFSTGPELAAKVTDVVGLYMAPPQNAIVLCVDVKSQIQALDRRSSWSKDQSSWFARSAYSTTGPLEKIRTCPVAAGSPQLVGLKPDFS